MFGVAFIMTLANHIFTEPFEANFVLDVAERGLRDMLAVTKEFHDPSIPIPDYQVLQRRVSVAEEISEFIDIIV
jgi:hypothetical protein